MTAIEFAANPVLMEAYGLWLRNPVTRDIIDMARQTFGPSGLNPESQTGERALYYAGWVAGAHQVLELLSNLEVQVGNARSLAAQSGLVADYGAKEALLDEGVTIEQLQKAGIS